VLLQLIFFFIMLTAFFGYSSWNKHQSPKNFLTRVCLVILSILGLAGVGYAETPAGTLLYLLFSVGAFALFVRMQMAEE